MRVKQTQSQTFEEFDLAGFRDHQWLTSLACRSTKSTKRRASFDGLETSPDCPTGFEKTDAMIDDPTEASFQRGIASVHSSKKDQSKFLVGEPSAARGREVDGFLRAGRVSAGYCTAVCLFD
ncbi:hypothetical protein PAPYR_1140 [Paratrimastix pyriformis]|uniref:Uncharacterized protein n=1 Tax=Paratrimastix pyriformis TaxID=342808 RepID=A0ABQ8UTN4_9EUKA|nr:hypothetical protein PAPYR_1140 [Paratrimastix pyriformis]